MIEETRAWYWAALHLLGKWPIILQDALQMMLLRSPNSQEELKLMVQRRDVSSLRAKLSISELLCCQVQASTFYFAVYRASFMWSFRTLSDKQKHKLSWLYRLLDTCTSIFKRHADLTRTWKINCFFALCPFCFHKQHRSDGDFAGRSFQGRSTLDRLPVVCGRQNHWGLETPGSWGVTQTAPAEVSLSSATLLNVSKLGGWDMSCGVTETGWARQEHAAGIRNNGTSNFIFSHSNLISHTHTGQVWYRIWEPGLIKSQPHKKLDPPILAWKCSNLVHPWVGMFRSQVTSDFSFFPMTSFCCGIEIECKKFPK